METIKMVAQVIGDYGAVEASPNFMLKMSQVLVSREFLPGTVQGFSMNNSKQILFPKFHTANNEWVVNFMPDRITIEHVKVAESVDVGSFDDFCESVAEILGGICSIIKCKVNRLAYNSEYLIKDMGIERIEHIVSMLRPDIEFYKDKNISEWSHRLVMKEDTTFLGNVEKINIISTINRVSGFTYNEQGSMPFEGFKIDFDINTIAENQELRYEGLNIVDFLNGIKDQTERLANELEAFLCTQ